MYFDQETIGKLKATHLEVNEKYQFLLLSLNGLSFTNKHAEEFVKHGLSRRIMIMKRCIDNVYRICPPDIDKKLSWEELHDVVINLHAFFINVYGALDNLAWVWVKEKNVLDQNEKPLLKNKIGFAKKYKEVRKSFPKSAYKYLNTKKHREWFFHIENFRHSLAHRIPLYVPPSVVSEEEAERQKELEFLNYDALKKHQFEEAKRFSDEIDALGKFIPIMTHSFGEGSPHIVFHAQILSDWGVVVEICELFIEELKK